MTLYSHSGGTGRHTHPLTTAVAERVIKYTELANACCTQDTAHQFAGITPLSWATDFSAAGRCLEHACQVGTRTGGCLVSTRSAETGYDMLRAQPQRWEHNQARLLLHCDGIALSGVARRNPIHMLPPMGTVWHERQGHCGGPPAHSLKHGLSGRPPKSPPCSIDGRAEVPLPQR